MRIVNLLHLRTVAYVNTRNGRSYCILPLSLQNLLILFFKHCIALYKYRLFYK